MDSSRAHYHEKTADRSRRVDPETSSTKTRSMSAPQPRSQRAPVNCCGQRHVYVPATPSWQVPPFRHGADSHLHIQPTTSTFLHTHAYIIDIICLLHTHIHTRLTALCPGLPGRASTRNVQEAQLSPRDRAMRRVN